MNNNSGVVLGVLFSVVIAFLQGNLVVENFFESIGAIIGVIVINAFISILICLFKSFDNFGKIFGQVSIVITLITLISFVITISHK